MSLVTLILRVCQKSRERDNRYKASRDTKRSAAKHKQQKSENSLFHTIASVQLSDMTEKIEVRRKKENDGELNKSVSVQGMPPCMTLLLQEMWGGGGGWEEEGDTEEKERGSFTGCRDEVWSTKRDEAINRLLLFRLPAPAESLSPSVF